MTTLYHLLFCFSFHAFKQCHQQKKYYTRLYIDGVVDDGVQGRLRKCLTLVGGEVENGSLISSFLLMTLHGGMEEEIREQLVAYMLELSCDYLQARIMKRRNVRVYGCEYWSEE